MTKMNAREIRINLYLSGFVSILGLLLWVLGLAAVKQGFFLIEYAVMTRGTGVVVLLVGLLWLAASLIKLSNSPRARAVR
ncbi:MAG: hypothetical protein R6X19_02855 [Kiritimatiellia bacterium]